MFGLNIMTTRSFLVFGSIPFLAALGFFAVATPTHAAVPVAVVQFDAGTDFEQSVLTFLGELLDLLGQKQMESTAAFELLKVEKAREDTNKLFQEVQEELTDYGIVLAYPDPRLQSSLGCVADPARCDAQPDSNEVPLTIAPYKDSRIIHNVFDYIYEEPRQQARVFAQCFFNMYIWHQAGLKNEIESQLGLQNLPNNNRPCKRAGEELCTYGRSTVQSINNIRARRDAVIAAMRRSNQYMVDYPQIFLFGDWTGYPEADRYGLQGRGEAADKKLREASMRNCALVLGTSNTVPPGVPDPGPRFHNVPSGGIAKTFSEILPTLGKTTSGRTDNSWWDLSVVREGRNNLDGITGMAVKEVERILAETQNERELTYLAGQGIRPERFYVRVDATDPANQKEVLPYPGLDNAQVPNVIYEHDTGYIISPAVILLQKMQAANQAMFDLAQKSFLYLDPESTSTDILERYNVSTNAITCFNADGTTRSCPDLFSSFEREICNQGIEDPDKDPPLHRTCMVVRPWLKPKARFKSAPDATAVGPRLKASESGPAFILSTESGLPAPWEDKDEYVALGNEKVGRQDSSKGELQYRIVDYLEGSGVGFPSGNVPPKGDNIGSKVLGADYAINDWYDRVFEMYEPNRNLKDPARFAFDTRDWTCYLATWFGPASQVVHDDGTLGVLYTPRTAPTQSLWDIAQPQQRDSFLPDEFEVSLSTFASNREETINNYCWHRLIDKGGDGSY